MKNIKFVGLLTGATLAVASLLGGVASALSGSMSLSGNSSQTSGTFAVTIYETSTDTINYAEAHLTFSAPVQNVSFDFGGSAFTQQGCGANCAGGYIPAGATVTGTNRLATVSFTLANPSSVTVGFDSSSYMAHPNPPGAAQQVSVSGSSSTFTYNTPPPATGGQGGGNGGSAPSNGGGSSNNSSYSGSNGGAGSSNNAAANGGEVATTETPTAPTGDVKADTTKKNTTQNSDNSKKNTATKKSDRTVWPWVILILLGAAAVMYGLRSRQDAPAENAAVVTDAKTKKADKPVSKTAKTAEKAAVAAPVVVAAKKPAPKKPIANKQAQNRKKTGKKSGKKNR